MTTRRRWILALLVAGAIAAVVWLEPRRSSAWSVSQVCETALTDDRSSTSRVTIHQRARWTDSARGLREPEAGVNVTGVPRAD